MNLPLLLQRNIILLMSEEHQLKDEIIAALKKEIIKDDFSRNFNLSEFRGSENGLNEILDTANTLPMMGERRLVIVHEFDLLAEAEHLVKLYPEPSETTLLVLVSSEEEYFRVLDKTFLKKFETAYGPKGEIQKLYPLSGSSLRQWLSDQFKAQGKLPTGDALAAMISIVGENMADLSAETLKVSLFIGKRKEFNEEDVKKVLATDTEVSKEAILAALARKDVSTCLGVFRNFMSRYSDKKYYLNLLGEMSRYFRNLLRASHMKNILHKPTFEIEKTKGFNLWSYEVKGRFFQALDSYTFSELKAACSHFYTMDRHIKSSGTEKFRLYFERLLIALCRRTPLRRREKVTSLSRIPASSP